MTWFEQQVVVFKHQFELKNNIEQIRNIFSTAPAVVEKKLTNI